MTTKMQQNSNETLYDAQRAFQNIHEEASNTIEESINFNKINLSEARILYEQALNDALIAQAALTKNYVYDASNYKEDRAEFMRHWDKGSTLADDNVRAHFIHQMCKNENLILSGKDKIFNKQTDYWYYFDRGGFGITKDVGDTKSLILFTSSGYSMLDHRHLDITQEHFNTLLSTNLDPAAMIQIAHSKINVDVDVLNTCVGLNMTASQIIESQKSVDESFSMDFSN